jgi:hypothetical protein
MNDFLIVAAFFVMVLAPCVISVFSFRKDETADSTTALPRRTSAQNTRS